MSRIAFFLPDFRGGGAERVTLNLINEFARRGHDLELVLCSAEGELLKHLLPDVQIIDLGVRRIRSSLLPFARYLRRNRPDALLASMWPLTSLSIAASLLAQSKTRIVVSEHSALSKAYADQGAMHRWLMETSIRMLHPLASARIAVSEGVRGDLVGLGLPGRSIDVVNNPIAPASVAEGRAPAWPGTGFKLLSVGNLIPAKNQLLLIDAFAKVAGQLDCGLMICGEGELRTALQYRVHALGMEEKVSLPGFVDDVSAVYAQADLFVLTSDWEGYSLVLLEALQSGLPIVSTDCDHGPREILDGGQYGRLVPVGDEAALVSAMIESLRAPANPDKQKERAAELGGERLFDQYERLLLGDGATA